MLKLAKIALISCFILKFLQKIAFGAVDVLLEFSCFGALCSYTLCIEKRVIIDINVFVLLQAQTSSLIGVVNATLKFLR